MTDVAPSPGRIQGDSGRTPAVRLDASRAAWPRTSGASGVTLLIQLVSVPVFLADLGRAHLR